MHKKKLKFDGILLIAIIMTSLGLLGGLSFASLPYLNFSGTTETGEPGNASDLNLLGDKVFGQGTTPSAKGLLEYILTGWAAVTATAAVAGLIVGAFLYITARGNDDQINKAKQYIGLTILGLVLASLAYLIVRVVVSIFY